MTDLALSSGFASPQWQDGAASRISAPASGPAFATSPVHDGRQGTRFDPVEHAVYGVGPRRRLPAIAAILLAHAALLGALVKLDVISVRKHRPTLTMVDLVSLPVEPPPVATLVPRDVPRQIAKPMIVAPPPIVQVPVAQPSPVQATPAPVPPAPIVSAAPAVAAAATGPAEPVTAPDGMARSLGNPAPRYPIEARRRHQEGTVRLRVVIAADGQVKEIAVARSSGVDILDDAALSTVRRWRFVPGRQAGVAVEAVGYLSIPFRLA